MTQNSLPLLKPLLSRAILALMLVAFLVPVPGRMPADEVRALYAAQGLLCDPAEPGEFNRDSHCVLCLLPSAGATPDEVRCASSALPNRIVRGPFRLDLIAALHRVMPQARAPPASIV